MKYDEKDIPQFQEDKCKKTCVMHGSCLEEEHDNHWYLMCPHYFNWKLGYHSFVEEQIRWQAEHPEETEEQKKKNIELAKKLKKEKKAKNGK